MPPRLRWHNKSVQDSYDIAHRTYLTNFSLSKNRWHRSSQRSLLTMIDFRNNPIDCWGIRWLTLIWRGFNNRPIKIDFTNIKGCDFCCHLPFLDSWKKVCTQINISSEEFSLRTPLEPTPCICLIDITRPLKLHPVPIEITPSY